MPILSVCRTPSRLSFFSFTSPTDFEWFKYPYAHVAGLFGENAGEFIRAVVRKQIGIELSSAEVLLTGFSDMPIVDFEVKIAQTLWDALSGITKFNVFYLDTFFAAYTGGFISVFPSAIDSSVHQTETSNFFGNLAVYPFVTAAKPADLHSINTYLKSVLPDDGYGFDKTKPIVFTGDKFAKTQNLADRYLLIIDTTKQEGIFDLYYDVDERLPPLGLFSLYNAEAYARVFESLEMQRLGTLVSARGGVECLVENPVGSRQIFDVKDNDMFVLPLPPDMESRVVVKAASLGTVEKVIRGGELGFIVDTRDKGAAAKSDLKDINRWRGVINYGLNTL